MFKRVPLTVLVACLTAIVASFAVHLAWPRSAPAPASAAGGIVSEASLRLTDRASLIRVAENYVRLQAQRQVGVSIDRQQVTGFWRHGAVAVVSLHETLSSWNSRKTFDVDVTLNGGAWQPLGMHVVTVRGGSAPPVGIPPPSS